MNKLEYKTPYIKAFLIEMEEGIASGSSSDWCPGNSCNAPGHNKGNPDFEHPGNGWDKGDW